MAATEILASTAIVKVHDGSDYVAIGGLDSIVLSDSAVKADVGNIDRAGVGAHLIAERAQSIVLKGKYLTSTRDPGQEAVEELAEETGADSVGYFQITMPGAAAAKYVAATATMGDLFGGYTSASEWAVTIECVTAFSDTDLVPAP